MYLRLSHPYLDVLFSCLGQWSRDTDNTTQRVDVKERSELFRSGDDVTNFVLVFIRGFNLEIDEKEKEKICILY